MAWLLQALAPVSAAFAMRAVDPLAGVVFCDPPEGGQAPVHNAPTTHLDCSLCQMAHASFVAGPEPDFSFARRQQVFETVGWVMAAAYRPALALNHQSRSRAPPVRG